MINSNKKRMETINQLICVLLLKIGNGTINIYLCIYVFMFMFMDFENFQILFVVY